MGTSSTAIIHPMLQVSIPPPVIHEFKSVQKFNCKIIPKAVIAHIRGFIQNSNLLIFSLLDKSWKQFDIETASQERTEIIKLATFVQNKFGNRLSPKQQELLKDYQWPIAVGVNSAQTNMRWKEHILDILKPLSTSDLILHPKALVNTLGPKAGDVTKKDASDLISPFVRNAFISAVIYQDLVTHSYLRERDVAKPIFQQVYRKLSTLQPVEKAIEAREKIVASLQATETTMIVSLISKILAREGHINLAFAFVQNSRFSGGNTGEIKRNILEELGEFLVQNGFIDRAIAAAQNIRVRYIRVRIYDADSISEPDHIMKNLILRAIVKALIAQNNREKAHEVIILIKATVSYELFKEADLWFRAAALSQIAVAFSNEGYVKNAVFVLNMINELQATDKNALKRIDNELNLAQETISKILMEKGKLDMALKITTYRIYDKKKQSLRLMKISKLSLEKGDVDQAIESAARIPIAADRANTLSSLLVTLQKEGNHNGVTSINKLLNPNADAHSRFCTIM